MPFLQDLHDATRENAQLAVREGAHALYVERLSGRSSVQVAAEVEDLVQRRAGEGGESGDEGAADGGLSGVPDGEAVGLDVALADEGRGQAPDLVVEDEAVLLSTSRPRSSASQLSMMASVSAAAPSLKPDEDRLTRPLPIAGTSSAAPARTARGAASEGRGPAGRPPRRSAGPCRGPGPWGRRGPSPRRSCRATQGTSRRSPS